eukprot:228912_1
MAPIFEELKEDEEVDNHKDYIDKLTSATVGHMPINIFADPEYLCCQNNSNITWQFGFVQIAANWKPEFMDVIKFKQFNFQTAAEIFNKGKPFTTTDAHAKWVNLYWFFDNRSVDTKKHQKNSISGMNQFLNDYKDGIMLTFNHKIDIASYNKKECFELLNEDDAIDKVVLCGVLRAYCHCDVIEWKYDMDNDALVSTTEQAVCISCNKPYSEPNDKQNKDECYWVQGTVRKHNNAKVFLCGKCIIQLVIEGTDKARVNIFEYLTDSLANNHKITELCLVHRLFATPCQLMELLVNSFCQKWEQSETAGMLKVINFVIKWINLLWFEDFRKGSRSHLSLNNFISFLLQQTNGKSEHLSIFKATQKLIKTYRDQYLLQQQLNAELQAKLADQGVSVETEKCNALNISSKVMLQNMDTSSRYLPDDDDDDKEQNQEEDKQIPDDLMWYDAGESEQKQKFFKYVLQKRNSIDMFREYEPKKESVSAENTQDVQQRKLQSWVFNKISSNSESMFLEELCREFAEQLTLVAFDLFRAIRPTELLCKAWTKKDKHVTAPNIAELIIFMEAVTVWAKFEIAVAVREDREKIVERMCRIGIELLKLENQYGAVQIYLALVSIDMKYFRSDLEILHDTEDFKTFMNNIKELLDISQNHASLRKNLWRLSSPAIPYLGVFLKDAFQADELLRISKLQKVNPKQMELLYSVYDKIEIFRTGSYSKKIRKNRDIEHYIHRQLRRSKQVDVKAFSKFCKEKSAKEMVHSKKRSFWG